MIDRRRAIRTGVASLAAVAAVVGTLVVANSLDRSDGAPPLSAPSAPITSTPSATPNATTAPEPTTDAPEPTPTADATPPAESEPIGPVQLPPGTIATTLVNNLRLRSGPAVSEESTTIELLTVGTEVRIVQGPVLGSDYWWFEVTDPTRALRTPRGTGWVASAAQDGTPWLAPAPLECIDADFPATTPTVESLGDLQTGIVGTWSGCVRTPWVAPYGVTFTFHGDGTYSARTTRASADGPVPALYYGTDADSPLKRYALHTFYSRTGVGQIDIVFDHGAVYPGDLRNISLMGDLLQFEFVHRSTYGPLTYRLFRD